MLVYTVVIPFPLSRCRIVQYIDSVLIEYLKSAIFIFYNCFWLKYSILFSHLNKEEGKIAGNKKDVYI